MDLRPGAEPEAAISSRRGTRGSVLLMDDDCSIQNMSVNMLESLGYRPVTCGEGDEAISLYKKAKEAGDPFAIVVLDIEIPDGMGGVEAARRILALDPEARLIVSSGNYHHPAMTDHPGFGFCAALPKPYRLPELLDVLMVVRDLSDGRCQGAC